jgi:hypothetical protein
MISAKDDEPEWVKDFYRKTLRRYFLTLAIGVPMTFIGAFFFTGLQHAIVFLVGWTPSVIFFLWYAHSVPPINAWKKAWLKEHQIRTKEDTQH